MSVQEHKFVSLEKDFYTIQKPDLPKDLSLKLLNRDHAEELGLSNHDISAIKKFVIKNDYNQFNSFAMVYAGHQFGQYVNQLGDGRSIMIGEVGSGSTSYDLQLKGSGKTPYSRFGDGRSVLRSTIREYLGSEIMHSLGVPTTRALMLFGSTDKVQREEQETAAVLLRSSKSHIRFGHFEFFHYQNKHDLVKSLADFCIDNYAIFDKGPKDRYKKFFLVIVINTAKMIAKWQSIGFCHGVLNTDNFNIFGETFDYGPYAFIENYNPDYICNLSDHEGRYSFSNQPYIGLWNCSALGYALSSLISESEQKEILKSYESVFKKELLSIYRKKLGLKEIKSVDEILIQELLDIAHQHSIDYTILFRSIVALLKNKKDKLLTNKFFQSWVEKYMKRHELEKSTIEERVSLMKMNNPYITPKNFQISKLIEVAKKGNFEPLEKFLKAYQDPYIENSETKKINQQPAINERNIRTSCSS